MKLPLITLAAAAALAGCAPPAPRPILAEANPPGTPLASGECFRSRDIRGHSFGPDDRSIFLSVDSRKYYRLTTRGSCTASAISSDPIVTRTPPGSELICKPIDIDIAVAQAGRGPAIPCIVESITRLSEQEVAALPPKLRP